MKDKKYIKLIIFIVLIILVIILFNYEKNKLKISALYNKELPIIKSNYPGNILINNMFVNEDKIDQPPVNDLIKWVFSKNPQKEEKQNDPFKLSVINDTSFLTTKNNMIIWLGHSSFFIRLNNTTFITDPFFYKIPFEKRYSALPFDISLIKQLDYVLISHGHRDHLHKKSVKDILEIHPNATFLVPLKMSKLLKKWGVKNIQEAGWYQQYHTIKGIEAFFLPARHWHKRGVFDYNSILWGSFMIRSEDESIYFGGDTGYGKHFKDIQKIFNETNIVIMPIGAYSPPEMIEASHIFPHEAIQAFNDLHGKIFIPMHYGTFDLSDEPMGEPIRKIKSFYNSGKLNGELKVLDVGENFNF